MSKRKKIPKPKNQTPKQQSAKSAPLRAPSEVQDKKKPLKFSFSDPRFRAVLLLIAAIVIYLLVWTPEGPEVVDPWFKAARLVDSSRKVDDPQLKSQLLQEGGNSLRNLAEKHPYHAKVHFLLGFYYLTAHKWDSAISEHQKAIKIDSGATINAVAPDAIRQLCLATINKTKPYMQKREFSKALDTLNKYAYYYKPYSAELCTHYGIIYHNMGILDSAISHYNFALRINSNHKPARNNIAIALFTKGNNFLKKGKADKAISYYQNALKATPNNPDIYSNLGLAFMRTGNNVEAEKHLRKALSINPGHSNSRKNLSRLLMELGRLGEARQLLN